jgi:glycosyltransferase involved in cell wall biosynthesis
VSRGAARRDGRLVLLVTVTFNPNQLRAHLEPILDLHAIEEVVLVTDITPPELPKLRGVVPSRLLTRLLGRAGAKFVMCCVVARKLRPHWILGFNLVPHGVNAILSALLAGTRSIYVMIGGPVEWEEGGWRSDNKVLGHLRRPSRNLERLLLAVARRATATVVMGTGARDALLARRFEPGRVHVIPASVDESRFGRRDATPTWDALVVAELIPTKRIGDFIEAVALLKDSYPDVRAAVVGAGPLRAELEAQVQRFGVGESVDFLGFRNDIENVYAASALYVLPSRYEGLSVSLLEAMASGLPVVVSDVGEARDVVRHGQNGFLYPAGDVAALSRHLSELVADPLLRRRLGEEAARTASAYAGRKVVAARYGALLEAN